MSKRQHSETLTEELKNFLLSSSKNTEQFGSHLLNCINVPTQLDDVLMKAVAEKRDIVIAGTAGSGKTHLLARLSEALPDTPLVELGAETGKGKYVRIVSDLTALSAEKRGAVFERPKNCHAIVVCANEGALLMAAQANPRTADHRTWMTFARAVEILHNMQRGVPDSGEGGPVVLDAAGYDPTHGRALIHMLMNELLAEVVRVHSGCDCDHSECPRRQAWSFLQDEQTCRRVATLVAATALAAEGFTFRVLWNFVADIALGGSCREDNSPVPTSAWFWRVFHGESEVAHRIRALFSPKAFAIPIVESHLWYGDWSWLAKGGHLRQIGPGFIVLAKRPCDLGSVDGQIAFEWLKAQSLFILTTDVFSGMRSMAATSQLWTSLLGGRPHDVIRELNHYMTYGLGHAGSSLELWLDYSIERRLERPDGQVSIGRPSANEFAIRRNLAAANIELGEEPPTGSRLFLVHASSRASLALTQETLRIIVGGRSFRMASRLHTEIDWLLMRFFAEVGVESQTPNELRVALLNFRARQMRQVMWEITTDPSSVSLSGDGSYV